MIELAKSSSNGYQHMLTTGYTDPKSHYGCLRT